MKKYILLLFVMFAGCNLISAQNLLELESSSECNDFENGSISFIIDQYVSLYSGIQLSI